jgi:hypothetical protein
MTLLTTFCIFSSALEADEYYAESRFRGNVVTFSIGYKFF